ncbi:MAG: hypothetical protein WKF37_21265 [Bryobacteraceae bacterium]
MVATTLSKMADFFAAQKRSEEAEAALERSAAIRAKFHIGGLVHRVRILSGESRFRDALGTAKQALTIAETAKIPDDELGELLAIYATALQESKRPTEAELISRRLKTVLARKKSKAGIEVKEVKVP